MSFAPAAIVAALNRHRVRYVVIGAFAAIAQDAPIPPTEDIDVAPERTATNLRRLSKALTDLNARIWTETVPEGLPFSHDATSLARQQDFLNLVCVHGRLDLCFRPTGFPAGYADLVPRAVEVRVGDLRVLVACVDDIIASKEQAGREKDQRILPALERWRRARR